MKDLLIKSREKLGLLIPPDSSVQSGLLGLRVQHPRGERCPGRSPGLGPDRPQFPSMHNERPARLQASVRLPTCLRLSFSFCLVGWHLLCMQPQEQRERTGICHGHGCGGPRQGTTLPGDNKEQAQAVVFLLL